MISLKIETLLEGQVVERNRVEYKEGWNPADIIHTICAFANDYSNVNGGYLVIGVAANEGIPMLPPKGIDKERLDSIQQEIFQYCNLIEPRYIPQIEVVDYQNTGVHLLYLKCSPGDAGPYQAPIDVYSKNAGGKKSDKVKKYWIRPASLTIEAKSTEISELYEKFNSVPYDDRVNRKATISDIWRVYLEDFLRRSNSSLVQELNTRSLEDLLVSLEVANETDTGIELRNIALLMFSDRPDKLIQGAQIDLVRFNSIEAEAADDFLEKKFRGPIWRQVHDALEYIKNNVIENKVVKIKNQAEAESYSNYPYNALEEALVNAVFHKSYREPEPVEIRIYVDSIQIINYPGPERWIDMDAFASGKVRARKYRNRRIGEFFKEIELSEKQSTGIPKILRELRQNGSPLPVFETDEERSYLITTIKMREGFEDRVGDCDQKKANFGQNEDNFGQNEDNFGQNEDNFGQNEDNFGRNEDNFGQKADHYSQKGESMDGETDSSLIEVLSEILSKKDYQKVLPLVVYLQSYKSITPKKAEIILKKSKSTVYRYLDILVDAGLVVAEGSTNNLVYKLK